MSRLDVNAFQFEGGRRFADKKGSVMDAAQLAVLFRWKALLGDKAQEVARTGKLTLDVRLCLEWPLVEFWSKETLEQATKPCKDPNDPTKRRLKPGAIFFVCVPGAPMSAPTVRGGAGTTGTAWRQEEGHPPSSWQVGRLFHQREPHS